MGGALTTDPAWAQLGYDDGDDLDPYLHADHAAVEGQPDLTRYSVTEKPVAVTDSDIRCQGKVALRDGTHKTCNKLLAKLAGRPWEIQCPRCHTANRSPDYQSGAAPSTNPVRDLA